MIVLYDHPRSGNCHKIRLFLSILGIDYENVLVDVLSGVNHQPWFAKINSLCQIPVITDDGFTIQDSQAILIYLAKRYDNSWFSDDAREMGKIAEWLSFSAKEIAIGLQASRLFYIADEGIDIAAAEREGRRCLALLDHWLSEQHWLCLDRPTIADIACFPYVALSREGKLPLDDHPHVLAWIQRIVQLEGYVPMDGLPKRIV